MNHKKMQPTVTPYAIINWDKVPITKHSGETGFAWWRSYETGNIRIRLIEYSPGYKADHWCCRGHVIHMIDGEINYAFRDETEIKLITGMSCCFSDKLGTPHKSFTRNGALLLIID